MARKVHTKQITVSSTAQSPADFGESIDSVTVRASPDNAADVYVGSPTVTSATGFLLQPGEDVALDIKNISQVGVVGTASDKVYVIAIY